MLKYIYKLPIVLDFSGEEGEVNPGPIFRREDLCREGVLCNDISGIINHISAIVD